MAGSSIHQLISEISENDNEFSQPVRLLSIDIMMIIIIQMSNYRPTLKSVRDCYLPHWFEGDDLT